VRSQKYIVFVLIFLFSSSSFALDSLLDQNDSVVSLDQFKGKYVVLEWLNFKCHMLKGHYEAMHIQRAQTKLRKNGAVWISVLSQGKGQPSYFKNKDDLQKALEFHSWAGDFAVRDEVGLWGKHFEAKKTPFHVLINPKGEIIYRGALDNSNPFTHSESSLLKSRNFLAMAMKQDQSGKKVKVSFSQSYGCPIRYAENTTLSLNNRN
jgi:peroxiredoxin